ncbi:MAG: C25 family cysteine peptidase, partial [Planctomycetota bacterium]
YDAKTYKKETAYPPSVVSVAGPFNIDDYCTLLIHICPFQYNPAKRELTGFGDVTVTINLTPKEGKLQDYPAAPPELNREAFGNLLLNPRRRIEERLEFRPGGVTRPATIWRGPEFLIIHYKGFKKAAEKLAQWKQMRGLRTEIVSIDSIGNTVDKIKKYLRNRRKYIFSRLRYVLLFGDVDMIASYDTSTEPWSPPANAFWGRNVTDYYYSTPRDPKSAKDYVLPWLSIGRIPVRTEKEAMAVVEQITSYEKTPPTDSDYYDKMTFAAYFQDTDWWHPTPDGKAVRGFMKALEDIRSVMVGLGFDIERVYVSETPNVQEYHDGTPVPPDVVASIVNATTASKMLVDAATEGRLAVAHRDHGSTDGWEHPPFTMSHLDKISGQVPTPFYSVNCLTGKFDLTSPKESFAEKILRITGTAPSLIAATRVSHSWLNNDLMRALFDAMWAGVLPTFPGATASYSVRRNRLGDILNYAKSYLPIAMSGSAEYIKDHFEIYHVVGDPTLELWKVEPRNIRIRAEVRRGYLSIILSTCPRDSLITIWFRGKMLKRIDASSTHIRVALRDIIPLAVPPWHPMRPEFSVCFWAPGYRFHQVVPRLVVRRAPVLAEPEPVYV